MTDTQSDCVAAARLAQEQGDWTTAIALWAVVRDRFPDDADGYMEALHCYRQAGMPREAEAMYGLAADRFPKVDRYAVEFAWQAHHRRDWDTAIARWERLRSLFPGHLAGFLGGAFTLSQAGRGPEADALLEAGFLQHAQNPEMSIAYARQAHHRGEPEVALPRWAAVRERFPDNPRGYIEGAACFRDAGRPEEGEAVVGAAVARFPRDLNLAVEYARLAERRADWPAALQRWAAIRSGMPEAEIGYTEGARALLDAGQVDEADALTAQAMQSWPENAAIARSWADLAVRRQAWPEALDRWTKVRGLLPDMPEGFVQGARALDALGRHAEAEALLGQGCDANPNHFGLANEWADLAMRRKDWSQAIVRWQAAHARFPLEIRCYTEGARAYTEAGRFDEADALLVEGIERFPGRTDVLFHWAHLAPRSQPPAEILRRWARFRAVFPDHHAGYCFGAWYLQELGRFDDAEALAAQALEKLPNHPEVLLTWGQIAQRRGDVGALVERYSEAVRRVPDHRELARRLIRGLVQARDSERAWTALEQARIRWPDDADFVRQAIDLAEGADRADTAFAVWAALPPSTPQAIELAWKLFQQGQPDEKARQLLRVLAAEKDPGTRDWLPVLRDIGRFCATQPDVAAFVRDFMASEAPDVFTPSVRAVVRRDLDMPFTDAETRALLTEIVGGKRAALAAHLFCQTWMRRDASRTDWLAGLLSEVVAEKLSQPGWPSAGDRDEVLSWLVFAAVYSHPTFRALIATARRTWPAAEGPLTDPAGVVASMVRHAPATPARRHAAPTRRLKIALCVSGQLRGYTAAFPSWSHLGLDAHDTTIFVDAWRDIGRNWQRIWHFVRPRPNLHFILTGPDAAMSLTTRYPTLAAAVLASDADPRALSDLYGTKYVRLENDKDGGFLGRPNVWKMHYKIERAHHFALEHGRDFDLFVRIRPDIAIAPGPATDWAEIYARSRAERLIFTDASLRFVYDKIELGDQFAAGTRDTMDVYASMLSNLEWCREAKAQPYGLPDRLRNHEALGLMTLYRGILAEPLPALRNARLLDPTMLSVAEIYDLLRRDLSTREMDGLDRDFMAACEQTIGEQTRG